MKIFAIQRIIHIFASTCPPPFPLEQGAQGGPFIFIPISAAQILQMSNFFSNFEIWQKEHHLERKEETQKLVLLKKSTVKIMVFAQIKS